MDNKDRNNFDHASDDWYKGKVAYENTAKGTSPTRNKRTNEQNRESVPDNNIVNNNQQYEFGQDQAKSNVSRSQSEQEKTNFEFGRDNYFNTNGNTNTLRGGVQKSEDNRLTGAFQNQVSDRNFGDDVDFEFGQDYYPHNGVNSENNRERQSNKNTSKNNRTL